MSFKRFVLHHSISVSKGLYFTLFAYVEISRSASMKKSLEAYCTFVSLVIEAGRQLRTDIKPFILRYQIKSLGEPAETANLQTVSCTTRPRILGHGALRSSECSPVFRVVLLVLVCERCNSITHHSRLMETTPCVDTPF
jgi:hypothetical protein